MITQKRKAGTEACSECCIDLRRINTHGNELTVIDRQLFLKLSQKAQLHLALGSPVSTVENNDQRGGGGEHFQGFVVSPSFKGKGLVDQHQMVYEALKNALGTERIHALALKTFTPEEWERLGS